MDYVEIGEKKKKFKIRKLTRFERCELEAKNLNILYVQATDIGKLYTEIEKMIFPTEKDQKELDKLTLEEEDELIRKIIDFSMGYKNSDSEENS